MFTRAPQPVFRAGRAQTAGRSIRISALATNAIPAAGVLLAARKTVVAIQPAAIAGGRTGRNAATASAAGVVRAVAQGVYATADKPGRPWRGEAPSRG